MPHRKHKQTRLLETQSSTVTMSDPKKGGTSAVPTNDSSSNHQHYYDSIHHEGHRNVEAPAFERVHRSSSGGSGDETDDDEKICRICLDDDSPETMIAPCRCKGGSKWVHRECLDEWRTNERDRAFSKCTECRFEYHLKPVYSDPANDDDDDEHGQLECGSCRCCSKPQRRRALFYWMVSRDVCMGVVLQQLMVVLLAVTLWAIDSSHDLPKMLLDDVSNVTPPSTLVWIYYLFGWCAFFVALGIYGCIAMCANGCNLRRALARMVPPEPSAQAEQQSDTATVTPDSPLSHNPSTMGSTEFYRRARRHRRGYSGNYHGWYGPQHYYYYNPMYYDDGCCCCCFNCCDSGPTYDDDCCCPRHVHSAVIGGGSSPGGSGSGGDAQHVLVVFLLIVAIVLAVVGFFVGVFLCVVVIQRIVSRHIYLVQKRQLVQEFMVMDLRDYDLDQPILSPLEVEGGGNHPPSAPVMPEEDVQYLRTLGLLDR